MIKPVQLPHIRNITVSGRIASGATSLARHLGAQINWHVLHGGNIFRELTNDHAFANSRPEEFDVFYENKIKSMLQKKSSQIIESQLSGFDAQAITGIFKVLVLCEDNDGSDKTDVRIDRLANRDTMTMEDAKHEVHERESQNLVRWRKLYANNDAQWVYWDRKYYDLVVNTFSHNPTESLQLVLDAIGYKGDVLA